MTIGADKVAEDPYLDLEEILKDPSPSTRLPSMLDTQTSYVLELYSELG